MQLDATSLRDFYRTPLGQVVRRQLAARIRSRWKKVNGQSIIGTGYCAPYLGSFRAEAARVGCLMPARQGALVWPQGPRCCSVLVQEHQWPLADNSVDKLLAVHCLEQAERVGPLLREIWRVLAADGRLLLIVPNRTGVWSRVDATPFGQGQPFSRSQLNKQLTDALFTPVEWSEALYFPPVDKRMMLRMAATFEKAGRKLSRGVAGVIIVEAKKELMAPVGAPAVADRIQVLRPLESSNGARSGLGRS